MKNAVSALTTRRLRRIEKTILEEPLRFDMGIYGYVFDPELRSKWTGNPQPACGTMACIAGWSFALSKPTEIKRMMKTARNRRIRLGGTNPFPENVESLARSWLKITIDQGGKLFHSGMWPSPFDDQYLKTELNPELSVRKRQRKLAKIAVARIEYFIKTGE